MSQRYLTYSIPLRDIFAIEGEKLREATRSYMTQCVERIERELRGHGGMRTLRVGLNEAMNCIDFTGFTKGEK